MSVWQQMFSKRMLIAFIMGMAAGLPLLLTGSTLQAWMRGEGVSLENVGLVSLIGLPYTLKFLWAPIFDRFVPKFLGRRRGWLLMVQLVLAACIALMGAFNPVSNISMIVFIAFLVTFFSASQDIVVDAYRRESLSDEELGLGSSLYVNGYRVAMLISGAGALVLADNMSWRLVYLIMGAIMGISALSTLFADEPEMTESAPRTLKESVIDPFVEFFKRDGALWALAFIFFYKVGDQMASNMTMPLYLDLGFSKTEVGVIVKAFGFWATIVGGLLGGTLMIKLGMVRSLVIFGILQMISTAGFSVLAMVGKNDSVLAAVISFENLSAGMGTAAYAAFMASLANKKFTATQYALLSSLMGMPRVLASAPTGFMAANMGYSSFFIFCTLIAIPGLFMIAKLSKMLKAPHR
tara:strand:- start:20879 stop:22102 length:1224 start_codon:yes stop_codon:yes gene_type:complete